MIQIDMQMPANCLECPMCNEYVMCAIPVNGRKWGENDVTAHSQDRPEWCPLKEQEAVEPHYTTLRYLVNGMNVAVQHPECPRCIENGLVLWDAEIEKGQAYCKRCGQAVKWE